jgi:hypothetical protein
MMLDGRRNWFGRLRSGLLDVESGKLRMGLKSGVLQESIASERRRGRRTRVRSGLYGRWSGICLVSWDLSMMHKHKHRALAKKRCIAFVMML